MRVYVSVEPNQSWELDEPGDILRICWNSLFAI